MDIGQAFADLLDAAGSRLLSLDPDADRRLRPLVGKVIAIELRGAGVRFFLCPHPGGLGVRRNCDVEADATLSGSPLAFAEALRDPASVRAGRAKIDIGGDAELAEQLSRLLSATEIDWEEPLARLVGDYPARKFGNVVRSVSAWIEQAPETLAADVGEYLQQETLLLVPRSRLERFLDDVDRLRSDVERLEQRIERLGAALP